MGQLEVLIPLGAFAWFAFMVWVIVDGFRRRQQLRVQAEFHSKLLDRVGSAEQLQLLFNSEGGSKLLTALTAPSVSAGPHQRILRALQSGLVLLSLGIGLFLLVSSRSLSPGIPDDGMIVVATITTALGVGLLLSAAAAYVLSQRMGLLSLESQQSPSA